MRAQRERETVYRGVAISYEATPRLLAFDTVIQLSKMLKVCLEELHAMSQIRRTHYFTTTVVVHQKHKD